MQPEVHSAWIVYSIRMCFKEGSHKQVCMRTSTCTERQYGQSETSYYDRGINNCLYCWGSVCSMNLSRRRRWPGLKLQVQPTISCPRARMSMPKGMVTRIRERNGNGNGNKDWNNNNKPFHQNCKRRHDGECLNTFNKCFLSREAIHLKKDCPKNMDLKTTVLAKLTAANAGDAARNNLV